MQSQATILRELERLYRELDQQLSSLPSAEANPCGQCLSCCRADHIDRHLITEMELELLADRVSPESSQQLRSYAERQRDESGQLIHTVCPHYQGVEGGGGGCQVYAHRPFSCRVFGHVRESRTRLPDGCVFHDKVRVIEAGDYYRAVPGSGRMRELWREFQLWMKLPPRPLNSSSSGAAGSGEELYLNEDDPLDRALRHVASQRFEEALQELINSQDERDASGQESFARCELWGIVLGALGRHQEALGKYERLIAHLPARAEFHYHAGCLAFMAGQPGRAERSWQDSCRIAPDYAPSLAMLGYSAFLAMRWASAADYFGRALSHDAGNEFYRARRDEALRQLGAEGEAQT